MLSTAYYYSLSQKENLDVDKDLKKDLTRIAGFFVALVIIDLIFLIYAIYCIFKCPLIQTPYKILLMVSFLIPGIGFLTMIGSIIYYHVTCKKSLNPAFLYY